MGHACLSCAMCGHSWRAELPKRPRILRSAALGGPLLVGGAIGACAHPPAIAVMVAGALVAALAYRMCTPPCPACGSERTLRTRFDLARDARVIAGKGAEPAPRRVRVG